MKTVISKEAGVVSANVTVGRVAWLGVLGFFGLLVGCADPPAFEPRAETRSLIEPAQQDVIARLDARFGTVAEPIAWEELPVEFHGAKGTATPIGDGRTFQLDLAYLTQPISEDQQVAWVDGDQAGILRTIAKWDEQSGRITVNEPLPATVTAATIAIEPGAHLNRGQQVHKQHCQQCHGATGAGDGPTSWSMKIKPRDYRDGVFKYTSTAAGRKASRDDLMRTLNVGVPGAYMPSYKMIAGEDKRAVIEYIRWLAMRGEIEKDLAFVMSFDFGVDAVDADERAEQLEYYAEYAEEDLQIDFDDTALSVAQKWRAAELPSGVVKPSTPQPPVTRESLEKGREIYLSASAKCVSCHGETGLGDGPSTEDFHNDPNGDPYPVAGFHDSWGNLAQPRNLRDGVWGGGSRPIDMYRRLAVGVKGTSMPGFSTVLSEEELWHLTNYVLTMPADPLRTEQAAALTGEAGPRTR